MARADRRAAAERKLSLDKRWYARAEKPHEDVFAIVSRLLHGKRRERLLLWRDLFLHGRARAGTSDELAYVETRARFNVIRNAVETLAARIGKQQPRPWIVTIAGDWKLQRKAKQMGRFVEGDFERLGADKLRRGALNDALIFGTGILKVHPRMGRTAWSPVWCGDVFTHPREEAAKHVRTMYQIAFCDREVLAAEWPDSKKAIYAAPPVERRWLNYDASGDDDDDLALVIEAWHLPSSVNKKGELVGGRHCVTLADTTLEDETWERETFPFAMLHASLDPLRMWGVGYPERMAGLQAEQNYMGETASEVIRKLTPKLILPNGSKITVDQLSNDIETWETTGEIPQWLCAEAAVLLPLMQAQALQRSEMYRIEGIGEDAAQGSSPDNLDSGKAKMVHRDIQSERHSPLGERNDEMTVDLAKLTIDCAREIAVEDDSRLTVYSGKSMLTELNFKEVDLGDDPYHVRIYPVSKLSGSPQAKLAQLQEMQNAGWITPIEARRLYDLPDLEASNDREFAMRDLADKLIEYAIDVEDGTPIPAPRYVDKEYLVQMGWKEYCHARLQGATDQNLSALLALIGQADSLIKQEAAELAASQPAPPAAQAPIPPTPGGAPPLQVVP